MSQASFVRQPLDSVIARYNRVAPLYRNLEWTVLLAPGSLSRWLHPPATGGRSQVRTNRDLDVLAISELAHASRS